MQQCNHTHKYMVEINSKFSEIRCMSCEEIVGLYTNLKPIKESSYLYNLHNDSGNINK